MKHNKKLLTKIILFSILFSLIFPQNFTFSATYTYSQNDWSSPGSYSTSSNIITGSDLKSYFLSSSTIHTSDIDFTAGSFSTTTVRERGTSDDAKVELDIESFNFNRVIEKKFTPRLGHGLIFYNNKLWIVGGDDDNYKNDVWYSSDDGIIWKLATSSASWSRRSYHTLVDFDNKMWLIGGFDYTGNLKGDVWYSSDGINWTLATSSANWSARFYHTSVVFDNKIWVIGGYDLGGFKNDVWYSFDGINWTLATSSASWAPKAGHASVVFDNKIWVLGGMDIVNNTTNDVWYSFDGINWILATSSANWIPRYGHSAFVFDNKIWVIGGYSGYDFLNDIWYSSDGINWIRVTSTIPWRGRYDHRVISYNGKIILVGGVSYHPDDGTNIKVNDIWGSLNGIDWYLIYSPVSRAFSSLNVLNDKFFLIGGASLNEGNTLSNIFFKDVWRSFDGINWELISTSSPWAERAGHASIIFNDKIWLLGGNGNLYGTILYNDVWYSSDGINWTLATSSANWNKRAGHSVVIYDNKIWVMGGFSDTGLVNDVWYSSDGINWIQANSSSPWSVRYGHTSVVFDNKIWIMGGTNGGISYNDVWYSSDGINWTLATSSAPWQERYGHTSVVFDNKIWVIGGFNNTGVNFNDVWYSSDGINWTLATSSAPWAPRHGHTSVVFDNKIWIIGGSARNSGIDDSNIISDAWYMYFNFYSSGLYLSSIIDTQRNHIFSTLNFNIQKPTSTDIKFQLSSSLDNTTWTDFLGPDGTTSTFYTTSGESINEVHKGHRYIRYKAFLETLNPTSTPSLEDIVINYGTFATSSILISNPIDTNNNNTQYQTLSWKEITPTGTQVIVSLRTANNLSDLNSGTWYDYYSTSTKCNKSGNIVTCDLTNPLPSGRYIQYKIEFSSDGLNTPTFDDFYLTYNIPEEQQQITSSFRATSGSSFSQVKYLLQTKQYDLARKIILEYPHLFKREYLLQNYPNLFTQEELNFISFVLGEKTINKDKLLEIISNLLSQIQTQQQKSIKEQEKYSHLKEKLNKHPLKNELKNFRFKKVLYPGIKDKDVKYLQIILNLDKNTQVRNKGLGSFKNETEYFGYFTQQAVKKFQEKYKEDILKPINKKKGTGIVGIMTINKLNEILEEITR